MQVSITFDTAEGTELSDKDIRILRAITGNADEVTGGAEDKPTPAPRKRAAAKKAAAAPPVEDDSSGDEPSLEDAVALATELVADGKTAEVKKVLARLKVKRVSELEGDAIAEFLSAFGSDDDDSPI